MRAIIRKTKSLQSPQRLLALTFAAAIAIGAALLATPAANADGRWHVGIDALFLSTSAVCVTGLDSIGIGASLSRFGLGVMLLLVELGGLGIMTVGTFFFIAMGRRLSRSEEDAVMTSLGEGRAGGRWGLKCEFMTDAGGGVAAGRGASHRCPCRGSGPAEVLRPAGSPCASCAGSRAPA